MKKRPIGANEKQCIKCDAILSMMLPPVNEDDHIECMLCDRVYWSGHDGQRHMAPIDFRKDPGMLSGEDGSFQKRVHPWMIECFGEEISSDAVERNHRFLEEALELVQSLGATADEAHQLVDYTFGRPNGDPHQEVGGVMVTLAALCLASDLNMHSAAEGELSRIWGKMDEIRAKRATKPRNSPLPSK